METLQDTLFSVKVTTTEMSIFSWVSDETFSEATRSKLIDVDVLIVPWDFKRDGAASTFPSGTSNFFRFLKSEMPDLSVEIASDEDAYFEVDLHSDVQRLGKIVLTHAVLPLFLGTLGSLIANNMSQPRPPTSVEMTVVVDNQNGKCISVEYKGPPGDLTKTIMEQVEKCLPNGEAPTNADALESKSDVNEGNAPTQLVSVPPHKPKKSSIPSKPIAIGRREDD